MALVQHAQNKTTTGTTCTVTLGAASTVGNCLIVCITACTGTSAPTVSNTKIGTLADNFAQAKTQATTANGLSSAIWTDQNCQVASTSLVVTVSASSACCVDVFEWSNVFASSAVDSAVSATTTAASWTATSATLAQPLEVAFGVHGIVSSSADTITGPGSPWTNEPQQSTTVSSVPVAGMAGFQQVNATTALTYSGTDSASSRSSATCIVTLKLNAPTIPAQIIQANQAVMRAALW